MKAKAKERLDIPLRAVLGVSVLLGSIILVVYCLETFMLIYLNREITTLEQVFAGVIAGGIWGVLLPSLSWIPLRMTKLAKWSLDHWTFYSGQCEAFFQIGTSKRNKAIYFCTLPKGHGGAHRCSANELKWTGKPGEKPQMIFGGRITQIVPKG